MKPDEAYLRPVIIRDKVKTKILECEDVMDLFELLEKEWVIINYRWEDGLNKSKIGVLMNSRFTDSLPSFVVDKLRILGWHITSTRRASSVALHFTFSRE